jgi:hypothetical protein
MPTAYLHFPDAVHYRREAFIGGLSRLGYIVQQGQPSVALRDNDVAVIWNKTARSHQSVEAARKGGGALIVCENGYAGKDVDARQPYAMALDGHNGSGRWFAPDDSSRLDALGLQPKPFRAQTSQKVVIAAQRGIGSPLMRSPPGFTDNVRRQLVARGFEVQVRPHPGQETPATRLMDDLEDARCLVVWSSNCATEAQIEGVPTYYVAPAIVTAPGLKKFAPMLDLDFSDGLRQEGLQRMAWAQWFLSEIAQGTAFKTLIDVHQGRLPSCQKGLGL